ncbi:MAG TPA: hypothetical protein VKT76_07535 [Bradyrhizobium sp.]|nr:hypothetical protein [Bradyrhizobium sp.]
MAPKATGIAILVAVLLVPSAYAQGFGKKSGSRSGAPVENKAKVDDKAYKAALDRIPTPKKGYDPWGQVHDSEPSKPANKP